MDLLELAEKKFGTLAEAEEKLFTATAEGKLADYSSGNKEADDPANADNWGNDRTLQADRIAWLCTDREASKLVTYRGIQVKGARLDGELDLLFATIAFPLYFENSAFSEQLDLQRAKAIALYLVGTHTRAVNAEGASFHGDVFLRNGFKAEGGLRLLGATIGGDLDCSRGVFRNKGGQALNADGLKVDGDVILRNAFRAKGAVRLLGATIGGNLDCDGGEFTNVDGEALSADGVKVDGGVFLRNGFRAEGEVRLLGATIGGSLECDGGEFSNANGKALSADGLKVHGSVFLRNGFRAEGEVRLPIATIGGDLACSNAQFTNAGNHALTADRVKVDGGVFLSNGFRAEGEVRLLGAAIGGNLECHGSEFSNANAQVLNADGVKVDGSVSLNNGFRAEGEVRFLGATIGSNLDCDDGHFRNEGRRALNADGLKVEGNVFLGEGFECVGEIDFTRARLGSLVFRPAVEPREATLDLRSATIGTFWDDPASWPAPGNLFLHGLTYGELFHKASTDPEQRLAWLRRQPKDQFYPQPYEELAEVLRRSGHEEEGQRILIGRAKDHAEFLFGPEGPKNTWWKCLRDVRWWSYRIWGPLIGYGYRPWRPIWPALVVMFLGCLFFWGGGVGNLMAPTKVAAYTPDGTCEQKEIAEDYPNYNPILYSIDSFVPLVDLRVATYYLPNANRGANVLRWAGLTLTWGSLLRFYLWIHIAAGWMLTTLLVVGLTGLVRR